MLKSFEYRTSITGIKSNENQENGENTEGNANPNADPPVQVRKGIDALTNATFKTKDTKLCVPEVTLSTGDFNKLLEQLKTGFKRTNK